MRSWLLRIVANDAKNAVRSAARRRGREERFGALRPAPPPTATRSASRWPPGARSADAARLLAALPERDREVLALPVRRRASPRPRRRRSLGVPVGTVKSRAARALGQARGCSRSTEVRRG